MFKGFYQWRFGGIWSHGVLQEDESDAPRYVRKDAQNERVDDNRIEFSLGH